MGLTVAITGVNSYFASTVLPRLQDDSNIDKIIGIDFKPWKGGFDKVCFFREDIRSNNIPEILKNVDTIYHFAYIVNEIQDKDKTYDININGSKNVFEACVKNKVRKVIYTSSTTVYGVNKENPIGMNENWPLSGNSDSYYNTSKVEIEKFAANFFKNHPDIIFTVLRVSLCFGPNIDNMFSRIYSLPVLTLPMGRTSYQHYIHEDDLGEALYLSFQKDISGIFNVGSDDAVSAKWAWKTAGVKIIPLPSFLVKKLTNFGYKLGLIPASGGWASLSEYTIFPSSEKFKKATGWQPKYSSKDTFLEYLESCERKKKDNFIQGTLSWIFSSGARIKPTLIVLNIFKLGKIPGLREFIPWMDHKKNSMSYLPVNKSLGKVTNHVLPVKIVHEFIDKSNIHVIMDKCGCRLAGECKNFSHEIGCLFMGESALKLPHGISRRVTAEYAHKHVERAASVGLIPMIGKVRVDNFIFLTPDESKLLSVCFCCHCCCMLTAFKHIPGKYLDGIMQPLEGLSIEVNDNCIGCGTCIETCGFNAIKIENGRAVHNEQCRGCGRCETNCPNQAITIKINNNNVIDEAMKRIEAYVKI